MYGITPTAPVPTGNDAQAHRVHKNLLEGLHFKFPTFKHDHPAVIDVNKVADEQMTMGQKIADGVASIMGSWRLALLTSYENTWQVRIDEI